MSSFICSSFIGLDATSIPEELAPSPDKPTKTFLAVAENMRFNRKGAAYTRNGFEKLIDLTGDLKVDSIAANENAMFAKTGTKIYYSTDDWATANDTGATRTAAQRDFMYPHKDELFAVNATDGMVRIDSSYNDNSVSGGAGTCISELEGSMLVGSGSTIKCSAASTVANPEYFYDFVANGSDVKEMSSTVRALQAGAGIVVVGMAQGIDYAYGFDLDTGILQTRNLSPSHGVPNAWAISYIENNMFAVFTGDRCLLLIADGSGVRIVDDPFKSGQAFDYPIRSFLSNADTDQSLSWTHFDPATREYILTYIINGISRNLVCNIDTGGWSVDTGKTFSCMTNWKRKRFAGDDSTDSIHQDDIGRADNGIEISHRLLFPIFNLDDKRMTFDCIRWVMGGLLSAIGTFTIRFYVDGDLEYTQDVTAAELIAKGLMSTTSGTPIGAGAAGSTGVGIGPDAPTGFRFTFPLDILFGGESVQVEVEAMDEGTSLELRDARLDFETDGELIANTF